MGQDLKKMKRKGNRTLLILVALLVLVALAVWMLPDGNASQAPNDPAGQTGQTGQTEQAEPAEPEDEIAATTLIKEGMEAPDFTVTMLDGTKVKLSDLRGKVVLVNFWATWCPPCRQELTRVQTDIVDRFAGRNFKFIPISRGEEREKVEAFMQEQGYKFPVGLDPEQDIYRLFASNYIPRNFLIDKDGRVLRAGVGYEPEEFDALVALIDQTLNK